MQVVPKRILKNKALERQTAQKMRMDISLDMSHLLVRYLFSQNSLVTHRSLKNLYKLCSVVDMDAYEEDREIRVRMHVIQTVLEMVYQNGITDHDTIFLKVQEGRFGEEAAPILSEVINAEEDMSTSQVEYIEGFVSDRLQYSFIFTHQPVIEQMMFKLRTGEFTNLGEFCSDFRSMMIPLCRDLNTSATGGRHAARDFSFDRESLDSALSTSITELNKPSNMLRSGIKVLNEMIGGGFQAARVYLILGETGGWKSGFLLSCVKWCVEHNLNVISNDPTKRPCILYLSQENDMTETTERLYSMVKGENDVEDLKAMNAADAFEKFQQAGWVSDDSSKMAVFIKYRPSRSIDTSDVDAMIDDLALEGYEVRMLVHDYVKRIKPVEFTGDLRLDFANVVDEFSVIAKARQIPVVTAAQLNREATKQIEAALQANKSNVGQKLGLSHGGESKLMLDNADYVFINFIEYQASTDTHYLTSKLVKRRGKQTSKVTFFAHPFVRDNLMQLDEDVDCARSKSLLDLGDNLRDWSPESSPRRRMGNGAAPNEGTPENALMSSLADDSELMEFDPATA